MVRHCGLPKHPQGHPQGSKHVKQGPPTIRRQEERRHEQPDDVACVKAAKHLAECSGFGSGGNAGGNEVVHSRESNPFTEADCHTCCYCKGEDGGGSQLYFLRGGGVGWGGGVGEGGCVVWEGVCWGWVYVNSTIYTATTHTHSNTYKQQI